MRLIDADSIVNYEMTGKFQYGELAGLTQCVWLPVEHLSDIPTVKNYFTDQEYRILLTALRREREVCEKVDKDCGEEHKDCGEEHKLIHIMNSIEKKIHNIQYGSR